jgi:hypothetical protein
MLAIVSPESDGSLREPPFQKGFTARTPHAPQRLLENLRPERGGWCGVELRRAIDPARFTANVA